MARKKKNKTLQHGATCEWFWIESMHNGLVISVHPESGDVNVWEKIEPKTTSQLWKITTDGYIVSAVNGKVLDLDAGDPDQGTKIILWDRLSGNRLNQRWELTDDGHLLSKMNKLCIDIYDDDKLAGSSLMSWPQRSHQWQRWNLVPADEINIADGTTKTKKKRQKRENSQNIEEKKSEVGVDCSHFDVKDAIVKKGTFFIHDNGGRPYCVKVVGTVVCVFKMSEERKEEIDWGECTESADDYTELVTTIHGDAMPGIDPDWPEAKGNTVLIRINDRRYVYIGGPDTGGGILQFDTQDVIVRYMSPVGNNDVPYPYAQGTKYHYLICENEIVANSELKEGEDPYYQVKATDHLQTTPYQH